MSRLTRRTALSLGAGAVAALAGCNAIENVGTDERTYDSATLASIGSDSVPRATPAFPLPVPRERPQTHRERARDYVASVPEKVSLPNEALADKIAEKRRRIADRIDDDRFEGESPMERLGEWRHVRGDAASLAATWQAATGAFDPASLESRRERLRSLRYDALDRWNYRAPTAATALVVHEWVERQFADIEREAAPWPPVPSDPTTDVFAVGEAVGRVERAASTLNDVETVLAHVRERDDPSHRAAVVAVANRFERRRSRGRYVDVDDYRDERGRPNFDRDIENTPARHAFEAARRTLEASREDAAERRRSGQYASAAMAEATSAVAADAFRAVVDGIRSGEYGPPPDADAVSDRWQAAVDALERAWAHEPRALSIGLADGARGHLRSTGWHLDDGVDAREIDRAVGATVYAEHYAERVPATVDAVVDILDD